MLKRVKSNTQPRPVHDWLERSTRALMQENVFAGIFPNARRECPIVHAEKLAKDLESAMRGPKLQGTDLARLRRKLIQRNPQA